MDADRKRELILTGGFNVYPSQVEAAIRSMRGVATSPWWGFPTALWASSCAPP